MTTRPRSRRSFRRSAPRRKTTWDQTTVGFTMAAGVVQTVLDISHLTIATFVSSGGTILRMIGELKVETSGAAADHVDLDVGVAVVTVDAFLAGAVPDPNGDATYDWYYWNHLDTHLPGNAAPAMNQGAMTWDIRTARRLRAEQRLVLIIDKSASTAILNLSLGMRGLWTLQA